MDDALGMRRLERLSDLFRDTQRLVERHAAARKPFGKRRALDELHDERVGAVRFFESVHVRDVWMVQRCQQARFAAETGDPFGIEAGRIRQNLDGDLAIDPCIAAAIHLAHAADTNEGEDFGTSRDGSRSSTPSTQTKRFASRVRKRLGTKN